MVSIDIFVSCSVLHIFLMKPGQNLERALLQGTYMLMKHYDLSQHPDAELKFGAPGLEDLELEEALGVQDWQLKHGGLTGLTRKTWDIAMI